MNKLKTHEKKVEKDCFDLFNPKGKDFIGQFSSEHIEYFVKQALSTQQEIMEEFVLEEVIGKPFPKDMGIAEVEINGKEHLLTGDSEQVYLLNELLTEQRQKLSLLTGKEKE